MKRNKDSAELPAGLTDREWFFVQEERKRVTYSVMAAIVGVLMLGSAFTIGYTADTEKTCSSGHTKKTTSQPTNNTKADAKAAPVEITDEESCSDITWPRGPIALGGLGLLFIGPLMIRLLPPGSRVGIAGFDLQAGPGDQAASAKKASGPAKKAIEDKAARRRNARKSDAPTLDTGTGGTDDR